MQNKKITTIIAVVITLVIVWMWNQGMFAVGTSRANDAGGTYLNDEERYMSGDYYAPDQNIELQ